MSREEAKKALIFVKHINNHLIEDVLKGQMKAGAKVLCKICDKDIDTINDEERLEEKK